MIFTGDMRMNITGPIILVDDDEDDHAILREVCSDLGIDDSHLHFFHRGLEFLEFLRATTVMPFIILCDINMPGINGLKLREKINEDEKLRRQSIPFVFFSTGASEDQVTKAYDLTVQGFFLKSSSYSETQRMIKNILIYWSDCRHPNAFGASDKQHTFKQK